MAMMNSLLPLPEWQRPGPVCIFSLVWKISITKVEESIIMNPQIPITPSLNYKHLVKTASSIFS